MQKNNFKPGGIIRNFTIKKVKDIPGIEVQAVLLEHYKTKAKYLHLVADDPENAFGVGFKTIPRDSTGVAHILEHTVLTGSKKYPVRDPFFSMLKRSLSSFMNAFTANDWTIYPFATVNKKDFYNLLDVYLNSVFFPTITKLNFMQEGHRLEIDAEGELVRQGVVYNEMKGAMSSPGHIESDAINKSLFTNNYKYNSGGDPNDIPSLTHEQLVNFHKRFYHPSNAFFYSYGDLPLTEHLRCIDETIKDFQKIDPRAEINLEAKRQEPAYAAFDYAVSGNEKIEKKFQAIMAWITAPAEDAYEIAVLEVLSNLLLDNSSSPLQKALIDSGLGSALTDQIGLETGECREAVFSCGLKDIAEKDAPKVEKIIMDELQKLADKGIDPELAESALHQYEFEQKELREQGLPRGLVLFLKAAESWFHGDDPISPLLFNEHIAKLSREIKNGALERSIKKYFLENNNRALIKLVPNPDKQAREEASRLNELENIRSKLTKDEIENIKREAGELKSLQEAKENLECLPTLALNDISSGIMSAEESNIDSNITAYEQPANGIIYFKSYFNIGAPPSDLTDLIPIFCYALPRIGTKKKSHEKIARLIALKTGGIDLSSICSPMHKQKNGFFSAVEFEAKCLERNIDPMIEIIKELFLNFDFSDLKRLKVILEEMRSNFESEIQSRGNAYALSLAARGFSYASDANEKWNGVHAFLTVKRILEGGEKALNELSEKLSALGRLILASDKANVSLISEKEILKSSVEKFEKLLEALPNESNAIPTAYPHKKEFYFEGWSTVGDASYAAKICETASYEEDEAPAIQVISKLIGRNYLHSEIREKGGAYGGGALYSALSGNFGMASYRDPHIKRTLEIFDLAPARILEENYSDEDIKEAVLQICAEIDRPESPEQKASRAFFRKMIGLSDEERRIFKEKLLNIKREDIAKAAKRLNKDLENSSIAVISYKDKLKKEAELGLNLREIL
jgi:presequence protease